MTSVHKPTYLSDKIASDLFEEEETQALQAQKEREELETLKAALRAVMLTREGRRVVAWIFELAGLDISITARDPIDMVYASARRDLALDVKATLKEICPELLKTMEEENDE